MEELLSLITKKKKVLRKKNVFLNFCLLKEKLEEKNIQINVQKIAKTTIIAIT